MVVIGLRVILDRVIKGRYCWLLIRSLGDMLWLKCFGWVVGLIFMWSNYCGEKLWWWWILVIVMLFLCLIMILFMIFIYFFWWWSICLVNWLINFLEILWMKNFCNLLFRLVMFFMKGINLVWFIVIWSLLIWCLLIVISWISDLWFLIWVLLNLLI